MEPYGSSGGVNVDTYIMLQCDLTAKECGAITQYDKDVVMSFLSEVAILCLPKDAVSKYTRILLYTLSKSSRQDVSRLVYLPYCLVDILDSGYSRSAHVTHRLAWCCKIIESLRQSDVADGWRVMFGKVDGGDRYYYVNDKYKQQKVINFNRSNKK